MFPKCFLSNFASFSAGTIWACTCPKTKPVGFVGRAARSFSLSAAFVVRLLLPCLLPVYAFLIVSVDPRDNVGLLGLLPGVIAARLPSAPGTPQADGVTFVVLYKTTAYVYRSTAGVPTQSASFALPSSTWWSEASSVSKGEDFFILGANTGLYKFSMTGTALGSVIFPAAVTSLAVGLDPQESKLVAAYSGVVLIANVGTAAEQLTKISETTYSATDLGSPVAVWFDHYAPQPKVLVVSTAVVTQQRRNYAWKCTPGQTLTCTPAEKYQFDKDYVIRSAISPVIQPARPAGASGVYYSPQDWAPTVYLLDEDENAIAFNSSGMTQNEVYSSSAIIDGDRFSNWLPAQNYAPVPESGILLAWALERTFVGNGTSRLYTFGLFPPIYLWLNQNANGANRSVSDVEKGWLIGGIVAAVIVVLVLVVAIALIIRHKKLSRKASVDAAVSGTRPTRADSTAETPRQSVVSLEESR